MKDNTHLTLASHCIGLDHRKPYKRHGRYFYRPYRNYYAAGGEYTEEGEKNSHGGRIYWLTREGMVWLGEKLGVKIWDEEE